MQTRGVCHPNLFFLKNVYIYSKHEKSFWVGNSGKFTPLI